MAVNTRALRTFLTVARLGSVGAAATALSLTQPAVSRTIRKLENELGVTLFLRRATGMEVTSFGLALLPHAAALETGLERAVEEINLLKGASKGVVRVGILPSLVPDRLSGVLTQVFQKLPGVQLQIFEAPNHQLLFTLLRGEIDFAIAAVSPELSEEKILITPLMESQICVAARSEHPIMKKKWVEISDLRAYDWALQEKGGVIWRDFRRMFADAQLDEPNVTLTANSIETLKAVIITSDLLTMLPHIAFRAEQKAKILQQVALPKAMWRRQIAVIRRAAGVMLPAAALTLSEFRKSFRREGV